MNYFADKPLVLATYDFWIKAFIPKHVPMGNGKYTMPVPGAPDKTMVPHPGRFKTIAPQHPESQKPYEEAIVNDFCYNTSNRGFSNDPKAESKINQFVRVEIFKMPSDFKDVPKDKGYYWTNKKYIYYSWGKDIPHCDPSIEYNCTTGVILSKMEASADRITFSNALVNESKDGFLKISFNLTGEAHLPQVPASAYFGNINYFGTIKIDEKLRQLTADFRIDDFPAFEAYASLNGGVGQALFTTMPEARSTVADLPGFSGTPGYGRREKKAATFDKPEPILPPGVKKEDVIWVSDNRQKKSAHGSLRDSNGSGQFDLSLNEVTGIGSDYRPNDLKRATVNFPRLFVNT